MSGKKPQGSGRGLSASGNARRSSRRLFRHRGNLRSLCADLFSRCALGFCYSVLHFSAFAAACSVLGVDMLFVIIFTLLGTRNIADPVEFEARLRRDRKMAEFRQTLALSTLVGILVGPMGRFTGKQLFGALRNIFARR